ncbi:hypothetical protein FAGAP_2785 [Fusarium agapanthi]|uniref:Uncharacterized protein n=1 Tax=Fusarium agapanthi TaxID=1803897 RepID=A0A9P5EH19_9HYPO|nr:hypothetical protein FAGAP_2785 [Fusarium agapanthi]
MEKPSRRKPQNEKAVWLEWSTSKTRVDIDVSASPRSIEIWGVATSYSGVQVVRSRDTPESPNLADLALKEPPPEHHAAIDLGNENEIFAFFGVDALFDDANGLWCLDVETRPSRSSMTE